MTTPEKDNCSPSGSGSNASSAHFALHVALQTMKERCQSLQKRLGTLEEENLNLRMAHSSNVQTHSVGGLSSADTVPERRVSNQTELEVLREKVSELSRQKVQLMDHISMVATENRQLWSRLSKLTKDQHQHQPGSEQLNPQSPQQQQQALGGASGGSFNRGGSQNLIRSKTFTKNAPNPKLRERLPREGEGREGPSSSEDFQLDLEDVALLNKCGFIDSEMGVAVPPVIPEGLMDGMTMGFLGQPPEEGGVDDANMLTMFDIESNPEAKRCTDWLLEIQKELLRQQSVLKVAVGRVQIKKEICQSCNRGGDNHPQMVDKTVEVGTDLTGVEQQQVTFSTEDLPLPEIPAKGAPLTPVNATATASSATNSSTIENECTTMKYANILKEKTKADALDKMCPMCGKIFVRNVAFDEFQEHVEAHFLDENDLDLSLDRTYEYISQTVGNF
ncbi:protein spindle-F [Uranotaenia lowii]|uniref:protein spindle-F n=1 Tax=Uranotaenia lowii TaxID=190385 RepID=UPI00247B2192|nr:protein spindle-F [Uranotaenia lowii]